MSNYYGFISKVENNNYSLTIEYGSLSDSPFDSSFTIDKKTDLSKDQVNEIINNNPLSMQYFFKGVPITNLY